MINIKSNLYTIGTLELDWIVKYWLKLCIANKWIGWALAKERALRSHMAKLQPKVKIVVQYYQRQRSLAVHRHGLPCMEVHSILFVTSFAVFLWFTWLLLVKERACA